LDQKLANDHEKDNQIFKLLLLGAGASGKSTVFKQMTILWGKGFTERERRQYIQIVYSYVINSMKELCVQKDNFFKTTKFSTEAAEARIMIDNLPPDQEVESKVGEALKILWKEDVIKKTWGLRFQYHMQTSAAWFFERVDDIAKDNFVPSSEDLLRTRVPTTGIVTQKFEIGGCKFSIMDVGGQRSERRKWIHLFENVTAILFVAAMSEYDQMLFEDDTCNRLVESLKLFNYICNLDWFTNTSVILFLNKDDIFQEKIMSVSLSECHEKFKEFPECKIPDKDVEAGRQWMKEEFLKQVEEDKTVFVHFTTVTDSGNIFNVFNAVKDTVLKNALHSAGFDRVL